LLQVIDQRDGLLAARDATLIGLLFVLGLRRAELVSLLVGDFDAQSGILRVVGKGRTEPELVTVPVALVEQLVKYLELRGNPGSEQPLLASHDRAGRGNGALTGNGLYRRLAFLSKLAGLPRPIRPHGLRHAAITVALDELDGDIRSVQAFARHAKPETTIRYDDHRRDVAGQVADRLSIIWSKNRSEPSHEHGNAHSRALQSDSANPRDSSFGASPDGVTPTLLSPGTSRKPGARA
jgi:integrase/recombinase XerC